LASVNPSQISQILQLQEVKSIARRPLGSEPTPGFVTPSEYQLLRDIFQKPSEAFLAAGLHLAQSLLPEAKIEGWAFRPLNEFGDPSFLTHSAHESSRRKSRQHAHKNSIRVVSEGLFSATLEEGSKTTLVHWSIGFQKTDDPSQIRVVVWAHLPDPNQTDPHSGGRVWEFTEIHSLLF
jgi:hypothetical protein